ncbi:hypothetical protein [Rhodococcus opacus]|uniref:hypothetical protein n=1 Tax=Rhodococcus opacus TaxID=37919 RepID=UPI00295558E6|nr:hypothetical protein [Rhodococcus opacus]MDV7089399.1 hypothetical protein [Rhodococcus opacus]
MPSSRRDAGRCSPVRRNPGAPDPAATPQAPPPDVTTPDPPTADATAAVELKSALEQLRDAQRRGDFSAFGAALDRLQQAVDAYLTSGG